MQARKPVGYTSNWEITEDPKKQSYYSQVSLHSDKWKLDFYNKAGQKLFTEHYAYAKPSEKDGEANWYYNGTETIRKTKKYTEGTPDKAYSTFHPNGQLHYTIGINGFGKLQYLRVASAEGKDLLDASGSGREEFFDVAGQRSIIREYNKYELISSYYTDSNNRKIYQLTDKTGGTRSFSTINSSARNKLLKYSDSSILEGEAGIVLVKFIITPNGQVEEYSLLRGITPGIDQIAMELAGATGYTKIPFINGKHGKEAVYQEIVVPFDFRPIRQSVNVNGYYYNHMWSNPIHNPAMAPPMRF